MVQREPTNNGTIAELEPSNNQPIQAGIHQPQELGQAELNKKELGHGPTGPRTAGQNWGNLGTN